MRKIKFRAWDKENQKMWDDAFAVNEGGDTIIVSQESIFHNPDYIITDRLILMQFTGQKDKNDTEVYEGDIVLCKIHDKEYMGLVEYTNTYGFYYLSGMGRSDTELWGCNEKKVIGNIYENPELMEDG